MFNDVIQILSHGGIIAYPTEAVYGLGCDPFNDDAIQRLLTIKKRSYAKGLIVIASEWSQLEFLVEPIADEQMAQVLATWPGPFTWLFPAKSSLSNWLCGLHDTIAVRVTAHPIAKELCQAYGKPIISTSANHEGQTPARSGEEVQTMFGSEIDRIVLGETGILTQPTEIRDARSGVVIRSSY
jgi:L-threonylcarbamoyladenylate synthase